MPELFLAIKVAVDRDRRPGRFLLTGSANVLLLPRLADALVGRMEVLTLWPLSQGEIEGVREGFVDALFADSLPLLPPQPESQRKSFLAGDERRPRFLMPPTVAAAAGAPFHMRWPPPGPWQPVADERRR